MIDSELQYPDSETRLKGMQGVVASSEGIGEIGPKEHQRKR